MKKLLTKFKKHIFPISVGLVTIIIAGISYATIGAINTAILLGIALLILGIFKLKQKFGKKKKKTPKQKKRSKKIINIILIIFLLFAILGVIGAGFFAYYIVENAPNFDEEKLYTQEMSTVYDSDGNLIAKLGKERREKITFDQLPQVFVDAIVATEDSRYFQHNGFDVPRFAKASLGQLSGNSSAGGGSTITMQVVKNTLTSSNQTVIRKFTDIYLAIFVLEKKYTKEEIIELYVNIPFLGANSYGVEEASQTYFGKSVSELTLSEAALVAGLFQSPSAYNPYTYPERAEKRRDTVLYLMELHGYITEEEKEMAASIPVEDLLISKNGAPSPINKNYQAFVDMVIDEVEEKTGHSPYDVPMEIYTTMNKTKQDALNGAIAKTTFKDEVVQTGISMQENATGKIVAIYGGRNKTGERTFNYATDIKKHIGSTAKPLFDYAPGFEYLNWNSQKPFVDEEWTYSDGVPLKNWDGKYKGEMILYDALGQSRNIPAVKAFQEVGPKSIRPFVEGLGLSPENDGGSLYETHAIGAYVGESPQSLAAAYAAFGNGGYYIEPYSVERIYFKTTDKEEIYKPEKTKAMESSTAYLMADCLMYNVNHGLNWRVKVSGVEVGGKSGTSNYDTATKEAHNMPSNAINDLWMEILSPTYSVAIWYGYDEISNKHYSKSGDNKYLITNVARAVITEKGDKFDIPNTVKKVTVEKGTWPVLLPSANTPADQKVSIWVKKGTEPTDISLKYTALANVLNLNGTYNDGSATLTWEPNISESLQTYLDENAETVGTLGYNIYEKNEDGTLKLLGYTEENTYTISELPTVKTFVIKTTYSLIQTIVSTGEEVTVSPVTFSVTLQGQQEITLNVGDTFNDETPPVRVYDLDSNPISSLEYELTITIVNDDTEEEIDEANLTDVAGNYTLTYYITYNGLTLAATRSITVNAVE